MFCFNILSNDWKKKFEFIEINSAEFLSDKKLPTESWKE